MQAPGLLRLTGPIMNAPNATFQAASTPPWSFISRWPGRETAVGFPERFLAHWEGESGRTVVLVHEGERGWLGETLTAEEQAASIVWGAERAER